MPGSNYVSFCSFVPPRTAVATLIPTTGTTADNNTTGTRREVLDRSVVRVVAADVPRTTKLLQIKWDFIFFTGSPFVGKIVSRAAAEHLTPTVMELGGKAPVVVDESTTSVGEAARRVAWGKWINSGQVRPQRAETSIFCMPRSMLSRFHGGVGFMPHNIPAFFLRTQNRLGPLRLAWRPIT
jgi:hypothetical protein